MRSFIQLVLAGLLFAVAVASPAAAAADDRRTPERLPGRYIVVYKSSVKDVDAATRARERSGGFEAHARYRYAVKGFAAKLSDRQLERLRADDRVAFVSPDRPVRASAPVAGGDSVPPGVARIEAANATTARTAGSLNVAVLDTGVDLDHPDLRVAADGGKNCVSSYLRPDDDHGHGTHVAGTVAARNQGSGVIGVAPDTLIHPVKVLDRRGSGSFSQIICGIDWARGTRSDGIAGNEIAVINMSLGGSGSRVGFCSSTTDALHRAVCAASAAGIVFVVAAGNDGHDFDYVSAPDVPAAYPQVITVSAMTDTDGRSGGLGPRPCRSGEADDRYASFSNWAETSAGRAHTIAAPGVCIRSTTRGGGHGLMSGTSMATPHVAGAVALCIAEGTCAGLRADDPVGHIAKLTNDLAGYGFVGDPAQPVSDRFFGPLAWAAPGLGTSSPPPADTTAPAPPTGLTATAGDAMVTLDWADNTEPDRAGYEVWRATGTGAFSRVATPTSSAWTDNAVTNGTSYRYVVRAVDTSGNVSGDSNEVSATPQAAPAPEPSTISLEVTSYKGSSVNYAYLRWSGADSTNVDVYRNGSKVATTSNDGAHLDSLPGGSGSYRYKLCEAGSTTECSNEATAAF